MVVKKRDIRSTSDFRSLVNCQVPSDISKLVSIVKMLEKKLDKPFLFHDCDINYFNSVEISTCVARVQSAINNN